MEIRFYNDDACLWRLNTPNILLIIMGLFLLFIQNINDDHLVFDS